MNEITQDQVREFFDYRYGELYWKVAKSWHIKIGDLAGSVKKDGRRRIGIDGNVYLVHRLIFLYHHGYIPEYLDHIDGNRSNNDITNLREATTIQNGMNRKKNKSMNGKSTSSKYKGIYWNKQNKKWRALIQIAGKKKHLGLFKSEESAAESYNRAAIELFGEYANLNIIYASKPL